MSKVVAVIPARSGSKGVPDKNIRELFSIPLMAYSIKAAVQAELIDEVYVSTDSLEYAAIANEYGAKTPFLRPQEISGDRASDLDFVLHFLDWYNEVFQCQPDFLVHLRPTTPLRKVETLNRAIEVYKNNTNYTSLRSVHLMSETAYKCFEIDNNTLMSIFSHDFNVDQLNMPRQGYPNTYYANGYVDIINVKHLLQTGRLHGDKVFAFITECVTEVDSIQDLELLDYQVRQTKKNIYDHLFGGMHVSI